MCDTCNLAHEMGYDASPLYRNTAWVDADGSYGQGQIILFDADALTEEQWEKVSELSDNSRLDYISAVLNNEPLEEWND